MEDVPIRATPGSSADFDPQLELDKHHHAAAPAAEEGLMVVADILDVWRLTGAENVVSVMGETLEDRQEMLVTSFAGNSRRVTLALPAGRPRDQLVGRRASKVYVRPMELSEFLA